MIWRTEGRHLWVPGEANAAFTALDRSPFTDTLPTSLEDLILDLEPELYWTLGATDGLVDQSGNGHDGTAQGGVTIGGGPSLVASDPDDSSTTFDASNDYITSSYNPFVNGSQRTFVAIANFGSGTTRTLIAGGGGAANPRLAFGTATSINFLAAAGGASESWTDGTITHPALTALTFDEGADALELFVNGASEGSESFAGAYNASPGTFQVGARASGSEPWSGEIAHVAVFERILTPAEIAGIEYFITQGIDDLPLPVTLNYRADDAGAPTFPRVKVRNIDGLGSAGDSADQRDNRVGAQGEKPRKSKRRGKTITYEGWLEARSLADYREWEDRLIAAFDDQDAEGLMVVTPHPLYDASGDFRYFNAKALGLEIGEPLLSTNRYRGTCVISVRNARASGISYFDQDDQGYK